jgi:LDH2 family malate/lactate/ureidoglycolate dehydrogenase
MKFEDFAGAMLTFEADVARVAEELQKAGLPGEAARDQARNLVRAELDRVTGHDSGKDAR